MLLAHTADEDWTQPEGGLCYSQTCSAWKQETSVEGARMGQGSGKARQRGQLQGSLSCGGPWRGKGPACCMLGPGCPEWAPGDGVMASFKSEANLRGGRMWTRSWGTQQQQAQQQKKSCGVSVRLSSGAACGQGLGSLDGLRWLWVPLE